VKQNEVNCISVRKTTRPNIVMSYFVFPLYSRRRVATFSNPQARANVQISCHIQTGDRSSVPAEC